MLNAHVLFSHSFQLKKINYKKTGDQAVNGPLFQFVPHYVWRYGTHGGGAKT